MILCVSHFTFGLCRSLGTPLTNWTKRRVGKSMERSSVYKFISLGRKPTGTAIENKGEYKGKVSLCCEFSYVVGFGYTSL